MYPIERYKYYTNGNKVIAVSTYAGRTVSGKAICDPEAKFDLEKVKLLAAYRCAAKIAGKRLDRACNKMDEACDLVEAAESYRKAMSQYVTDASVEFREANENLENLLKSL